MEVLDLGNNGMSAEAAASLAGFMTKHRGLRDLNLYMNDIGSEGLQKVHEVLLLPSSMLGRKLFCHSPAFFESRG